MLAPVSSYPSSMRAEELMRTVSVPSAGDPAAENQASDAERNAFSSLMQSPGHRTIAKLDPASPPGTPVPSLIEKFAVTQNADMRDLLQSARDLVKAAPKMSFSEITAFGNEMTMSLAVTTTQFNVAGNLGKSASKGVETLMRNQ